MEKKINNVYGYLDYRILLNEDFIIRSTSNKNYSLRSYARDLGLSAGFLSEILRGKKDLSIQNAGNIFIRLGFNANELKYAENLVQMKTAKEEDEREAAKDFITKFYNGTKYQERNDMDLIIKSPWHMLMFAIARKLNNKAANFQLLAKLGLSEEDANEILQEFVASEYLDEKDGKILVREIDSQVKNHQRILDFSKEYFEVLCDFVHANGGVEVPTRVAHSLALGISNENFEMINEAHVHYIKTLNRIAHQSQNADQYILVSNLFVQVKN